MSIYQMSAHKLSGINETMMQGSWWFEPKRCFSRSGVTRFICKHPTNKLPMQHLIAMANELLKSGINDFVRHYFVFGFCLVSHTNISSSHQQQKIPTYTQNPQETVETCCIVGLHVSMVNSSLVSFIH